MSAPNVTRAPAQDWRTLPAGRDLDIEVGVRVLGLKRALLHTEAEGVMMDVGLASGPVLVTPVEHYSTDIAAAWQVVEKLGAEGLRLDLSDDRASQFAAWVCYFDGRECVASITFGPTAPLAICRAALATLGGEDA